MKYSILTVSALAAGLAGQSCLAETKTPAKTGTLSAQEDFIFTQKDNEISITAINSRDEQISVTGNFVSAAVSELFSRMQAAKIVPGAASCVEIRGTSIFAVTATGPEALDRAFGFLSGLTPDASYSFCGQQPQGPR